MSVIFLCFLSISFQALARDFSYFVSLKRRIENYPITKDERSWIKKNDTSIKLVESCLKTRGMITINTNARNFFKNIKEDSDFYEPVVKSGEIKRIKFEQALRRPSPMLTPEVDPGSPVYGALFLTGNTVGFDPGKVVGGAKGYGEDVFILNFDPEWIKESVTYSGGDSIRPEIKSWAQDNPESFLASFQYMTPLFLVRTLTKPDKNQKATFDVSLSNQTMNHFMGWCESGGEIKKGSYIEVQIHRRLPLKFFTDLIIHDSETLKEYQDDKKDGLNAAIKSFSKKHDVRIHFPGRGV